MTVVLLFLRCFRTPGGLVEQPPLAVPGSQSKALKEHGEWPDNPYYFHSRGYYFNTTLTEVEKAQEKGKALLMMGGVEVSMVGDEWRSRSRQEVDLVFYPCSSGVGR